MLIALLSITSCSKIVYTHEQVMLSYHTKADVVKQFGYPDQKKEAKGITEWVYNCDTTSMFFYSQTKVAVNGRYNGILDSLKTANVNEFTSYSKYIRFVFDETGRVLRYDSHGVDFAERKPNGGGTAMVIIGSAAAFYIIVGILAKQALADAFKNITL